MKASSRGAVNASPISTSSSSTPSLPSSNGTPSFPPPAAAAAALSARDICPSLASRDCINFIFHGQWEVGCGVAEGGRGGGGRGLRFGVTQPRKGNQKVLKAERRRYKNKKRKSEKALDNALKQKTEATYLPTHPSNGTISEIAYTIRRGSRYALVARIKQYNRRDCGNNTQGSGYTPVTQLI